MDKVVIFLKTILRGVGQVMLQKSAATGALFLVGIFYNSWKMGMGALIGVLCGTVFAYLFKYKKEDIEDGFYGFNAVLVGIALIYFYSLNWLLVLFIILGSALSVLVMHFMHTKNLYPYTFPFVISTWVLIIVLNFSKLIEKNVQAAVVFDKLDILSSISMGLGQVMFQGCIITGIIFLLLFWLIPVQRHYLGWLAQ